MSRTLESRIHETAQLFSAASGLLIVREEFTPSNPSDTTFVPADITKVGSTVLPFSYGLVLSDGTDTYELAVDASFTDKYTPREWLRQHSWSLTFNGDVIVLMGSWIDTSTDLTQADINAGKVYSARMKSVFDTLDSFNRPIITWNYEGRTVAELCDEITPSPYLIFMAHQVERGIEMPPVMINNPELRDAMHSGDTSTVNRMLAARLLLGSGDYRPGAQALMAAEAEAIKGIARGNARQNDPTVPLYEKFIHLPREMIPGDTGERTCGPYNILVVENDLQAFGQFTDIVVGALETDGRYSGTQVYTEYNLPNCMKVCATGQVDMVLFHWVNPSSHEAMMLKGDANPMYRLFQGDAQGVITMDDKHGIMSTRQDGKTFDATGLEDEAKRLNIRLKWMNMITQSCLYAGVPAPPHFIVQSTEEYRDLSKIVSQKLGIYNS